MDEWVNGLPTKTEQAKALGIDIPEDDYWGDMTSRVCGEVGGAIGGNFTKEAVKRFEEKLVQRDIQ